MDPESFKVREVSKFPRRFRNEGNYSQFFAIGKYIVEKDGNKWRASFLSEKEEVKHFEFVHDTGKDKIAINKGECQSNSFYLGTKKYVLAPPQILNNRTSATVNLISSTCNKTVKVEQKNDTSITQINANKELLLSDGTLQLPYLVFAGNEVSSRI